MEMKIKTREDVKRLSGGAIIAQGLIADFIISTDKSERIKIANALTSLIQTGINERKQTLDEEKFNNKINVIRPALENIEKENDLPPVFSALVQEERKLSMYDVKQQITQWHKENSNGGPKDFLPNGHQLEESGPQYEPVIEAIYDLGGFEYVAGQLGLQFNK